VALIIPSLFKLIGDGFESDAYSADGNHLRWMFDPRLGFPRAPFCLERRRSVMTDEGRRGVRVNGESFVGKQVRDPWGMGVERIVRGGMACFREGLLSQTTAGLVLESEPLIVDFHGGSGGGEEPYACWVRLHLRAASGDAEVSADALYANRGEFEVVDRAGYAPWSRDNNPEQGTRPNDAAEDLTVDLRADRIDRVAVTGGSSYLVGVEWVRSEDIMAARDWEEVECYGIPTCEESYLRTHGRMRTHGYGGRLPEEEKRECVDFRDVKQREFDNPTVIEGFGFEVHDATGAPAPFTRIVGWGGLQGLDCGFRLEVKLPFTAQEVEVTLAHFAKPADVEAYDPSGALVASATMSAPNGQPETLVLAANQIAGVVVIPPSDETILIEICAVARRWSDDCEEFMERLALERLVDPLPRGAEPLDDPQVPPSRPPTTAEIEARYLRPWTERLLPWLNEVLSQSATGVLHQSEVEIKKVLTDFGQAPIGSLPSEVAGLTNKTVTIRPYELILAASTAFRFAKLLGLAAVDIPPARIAWDYRVRGRWRTTDIAAWGNRGNRELADLQARLSDASPWEIPALQAQVLDKYFELATETAFINFLVGSAVGGVVELWALKVGVAQSPHALFAGPSDLDVFFDGLATPAPGSPLRAVARLEWPLRQRARVIIDEDIPLGAAIGRRPQGSPQPFSHVLNPLHPDFGTQMPVLPAGPAGTPGASGTAVFRDRSVDDGVDLRYGVSECDPFGRWSEFAEEDFRWDNNIPPADPVSVGAALELTTGTSPQLELTVSFSWPTDLEPVTGVSFRMFLNRSAPASSDPHNPAQWPNGFRRGTTGAAGPFTFAATFAGSTTHDGMAVVVAFNDTTRTDPAGNVFNYRDFTLTFAGLQLTRDAIDRARAWVGVQAEGPSGLRSSVAGPGLGEDILESPPPVVSFPGPPERATFADAERMSSYTLQWTGVPDVRYLVYRCGERELVKHLQDKGMSTSVYDEGDPPNLRAAALKSLAVQARDAFVPRSPLLPDPPRDSEGFHTDPQTWPALAGGARQYTDALAGQLRTLTVYTVLGKSRAGVLSAWPTAGAAFVVVEVPHAPEPAPPVCARATWQPPIVPPPPAPAVGTARVELLIAEPPPESADVASYEVYRTIDPAKAQDYRRMRPLHRLDSPVYETVTGVAVPVATYVDPTVLPYATYYYRIVARAAGPTAAVSGMRSGASNVIQVETLSGDAPTPPTLVTTTRVGALVTVGFQADAPELSSGDFLFDVIEQTSEGPNLVARSTARAARAAAGSDQFAVDVDGTALAAGDNFTVRTTDPRGRSTESTAAMAT
jgi:hypothetical protein